MQNKKYKLNKKNIFLFILLLIFIIIFINSLYNTFKWKKEDKKINNEIEEIYDVIDISDINDNEKTEIINQVKEIPKFNPYWDYIKMNLIEVDFEKLRLKNLDTKGWLQVNGTNINYPFVQSNNNEYYLTHSFNKTYNTAGWVFLDYRNNLKKIEKNTIIYAHGRLNNIMFGSLKNIIKSNWYENIENHIIKLSTDYHNTLWQVFSVYIIDNTNDYLKVSFNDHVEFETFANMLLERSIYDFKTNVNEDDKIITLSTCYNKNKKVVMHGKLIKIEEK